MKYLYLLIVTIFIASCGTKIEEEKMVSDDKNTVEVTNEINNEVKNLDIAFDDTLTKMVKLDAKYKNPAGDVDMVISYSLDNEGKIEVINLDAPNFDLKDYNTAAQVLVGKTIEEAKNTGIAGGSLITEAFKKALK
ncbi:MAG: hypothetical protein PHV23_01820 [Candidatus Gracilibacteria bacterium]|nr:hypothetical protein [Candidatus Gracilibacteria bacterium]